MSPVGNTPKKSAQGWARFHDAAQQRKHRTVKTAMRQSKQTPRKGR